MTFFHCNTKISHHFDLDESEDKIGYNMIIGIDLLSELNMNVRFSNGTIKWEDQLVLMKSFHKIWKNEYPTRKKPKATVLYSVESKATKEATDLVLKILDLKYKKANLSKVVEDADNLNKQQKRMLLKLLKQYNELFDSTLGKWKTALVIIKMRPDANPVNS